MYIYIYDGIDALAQTHLLCLPLSICLPSFGVRDLHQNRTKLFNRLSHLTWPREVCMPTTSVAAVSSLMIPLCISQLCRLVLWQRFWAFIFVLSGRNCDAGSGAQKRPILAAPLGQCLWRKECTRLACVATCVWRHTRKIWKVHWLKEQLSVDKTKLLRTRNRWGQEPDSAC